ncbi:hypothetical protein H2508_01395 [Parahaliea sp. F7430]|uniref:Uncharacterized protein n=1 Tax=Sediminihaliea albiluteola TaxID=2758564 RepID=A0A7W2TTU7_9GAMM|nr:hypothetical protein [Sediminihaliea albiluteola]MBA6411763.1 hypothetical protein [Sediminihaliea albiluteola]
MEINGIDIRKESGGFYSARDIHRSSGKGSSYRPDVFLASGLAKNVAGSLNIMCDDESQHVKRSDDPHLGIFFSSVLSVAYAAWLEVAFSEFFKGVSKDVYALGYVDGEEAIEREVKGAVEQGYKVGYQECKRVMDEFVGSVAKHPVQKRSISSVDFWRSVFPESNDVPHEFLKYLLLRAASYRNMGRNGLLSEYDWEAGCYWMTPEFAFSVASFFGDGSQEHLSALRFISVDSAGEAWASEV